MALLGDVSAVKVLLAANEDSVFGANVDERLAEIQLAVSARFEFETGRTFGTPAADTTELFWAFDSELLIFDRPARAITSVTVGGTVAGSTVTGGTVYSSAYWTHDPTDRETGLIYGLRLLTGGAWGWRDARGRPAGPVVVVGDFSDTDDDTVVPADLTYAANLAIAESYRLENTGPMVIDGTIVPRTDPFKNPMVAAAIRRYRAGDRALPAF